jgi:hypothetical protein
MKELKKQKKKKNVFTKLNANAFCESGNTIYYSDVYYKTGGDNLHSKGTDSSDFSDVLF